MTKEELEKAYFHIINEYSEPYNSDLFYKELSAFRDLCIRIGFEAGHKASMCWITPEDSLEKDLENFLKEIE